MEITCPLKDIAKLRITCRRRLVCREEVAVESLALTIIGSRKAASEMVFAKKLQVDRLVLEPGGKAADLALHVAPGSSAGEVVIQPSPDQAHRSEFGSLTLARSQAMVRDGPDLVM